MCHKTLVQMWIGRDLPAGQREDMQHNHGMLDTGDEHVLVCDRDLKIEGAQVLVWDDFLAEMHREIGTDAMEFHRQHVVEGPRFTERHALSDLVRLHLATQIPDMVWADADCRILKWWEQPAGGAYFAVVQAEPLPLRVDQALFSVNGDTGHFNRLLQYLLRMDAGKIVNRRYLWGAVNRREAGDYNLIPPECFRHVGSERPCPR